VETQQGGRLHNDGGTEHSCGAHEKSTQTGEDTIRGTQIGRTLAAPIEDQQLMAEQYRLGNNGTEASGPREPACRDHQMNQKDDNIAHLGILTGPPNCPILAQFSNSPWTPWKFGL